MRSETAQGKRPVTPAGWGMAWGLVHIHRLAHIHAQSSGSDTHRLGHIVGHELLLLHDGHAADAHAVTTVRAQQGAVGCEGLAASHSCTLHGEGGKVWALGQVLPHALRNRVSGEGTPEHMWQKGESKCLDSSAHAFLSGHTHIHTRIQGR